MTSNSTLGFQRAPRYLSIIRPVGVGPSTNPGGAPKRGAFFLSAWSI